MSEDSKGEELALDVVADVESISSFYNEHALLEPITRVSVYICISYRSGNYIVSASSS